MKIVTTIDDGGLHPAVRRAALQLAAEGRATSMSVLANGPDVEKCLDIEVLAIGVQVNVLRGKPLLGQEQVNTLLRHNGCFYGNYADLFQAFLAGKISMSQIEAEWDAQIQSFVDRGVRPTHLCSDASMHAWPGLMAVLGRLAERHNIGWVRRPQQCEDVLNSGRGRMRKEFMNICSMLRKKDVPVQTPDLVWGAEQEQGDGLAATFVENLMNTAYEVVEVVGRPGIWELGDDEVPKPFQPSPTKGQWGQAMSAMQAQGWVYAMDQLGAEPAHFGELERTGT